MDHSSKQWSCKRYLIADFRQINSHHRMVLQPRTFTHTQKKKKKTQKEVKTFLPTALLLALQNIITGARAGDHKALILSSYLSYTTLRTEEAEKQKGSPSGWTGSSNWGLQGPESVSWAAGDLKPGSSEAQLFPSHLWRKKSAGKLLV